MYAGGNKHNVLPGRAYAIVNHRVHPGDTLDDVLEHDKQVLLGLPTKLIGVI